MVALNKKSTERTDWIDTARGYGIILVIMGHILMPDSKWSYMLLYLIYSCHMPLFFIISGYLCAPGKYTPREFMIKRIKSLLIPYLWLGAIIIGLNWSVFHFGSLTALLDYFKELLVQKRFHVIWYLLCLFLVEMLLYGIVKLTKDKMVWILLSSSIITMFGLLYYRLGGKALPWNLDICPIALFFLSVGYCLRNIRLKWDRKEFGIAFLVYVVSMIANFEISGAFLEMFRMQYGFVPLTFLAALSGSYLILWVAHKKDWKGITFIGRYSMLYYGLHQAMTLEGCKMLCDAMGWFPNRYNFWQGMGYLLFTTVITIVFFTLIQLFVNWRKKKRKKVRIA